MTRNLILNLNLNIIYFHRRSYVLDKKYWNHSEEGFVRIEFDERYPSKWMPLIVEEASTKLANIGICKEVTDMQIYFEYVASSVSYYVEGDQV